jgi:biopolymer transport protein ExbD
MAGGSSSNDDEEMISGINVTPLVDVVLVLLIILMVTANYLVSKSIEVTLPQAVDPPATPTEVPQQINVQIDAEGNIFIDAVPADDATLAARARDLVASAGETASATITADTHAEHGAVIRVMSILNHERLTRFSFNVSPDALPAP